MQPLRHLQFALGLDFAQATEAGIDSGLVELQGSLVLERMLVWVCIWRFGSIGFRAIVRRLTRTLACEWGVGLPSFSRSSRSWVASCRSFRASSSCAVADRSSSQTYKDETITGSISLTYRELRAQVAYTPWFDWVLEVFGLVEVCGIGVLEFGVLTGLGGERLCGYLELGILAAI